MAQQFLEHQRLVDGADAHLLGDGVPEALVGGGGVWGHGGNPGWGVTGGGIDKGDASLPWRSRALLHPTTAWRPEPISGSAPWARSTRANMVRAFRLEYTDSRVREDIEDWPLDLLARCEQLLDLLEDHRAPCLRVEDPENTQA